MDPVIDNEWLNCKNDPVDEVPSVGNVARSWQWRERGINPPHSPSNTAVLENIAEDILVQKPLSIRCCDLPGYPRSTFLMVFSPDGTKVASTHGNHNVYVSELASGKHVRILRGHPRTPWCIAFHPSHTQLIGSGCLGGQVRVWDINSGGSETWNVHKETVIASIAFHPRLQLLVIATYNELYFWDWSQPTPFTRVSTNNINEKVRYVAFDALGYKLITGISLWANSASNASVLQHNPTINPMNNPGSRRNDEDSSRNADAHGSPQDMIVNSYQNLVQRYDSLVRNYQRLFMVRHRLTSTPPPPNTIDRGTDPMETDVSPTSSGVTRTARSTASSAQNDDGPSTSRRADAADSGDGEANSSRLLNLDVLSFDSNPSRNQDSTPQEHSIFGSRPSAFQPLPEGRPFWNADQRERSTRLLPNPFSSTNTSRSNRTTLSDSTQQPDNTANTARTSIFTSSRPESTLGRAFLERRRNSTPGQNSARTQNTSASTNNASPRRSNASPGSRRVSNTEMSTPSPQRTPGSGTRSQRPTMTNSSTQMSPLTGPVDAQTINESLDLIRDILRDSGTRLLNLITNMSWSTLASVERSMPRRGTSRTQSDDSESGGRPRGLRPRIRLLSPRSTLRHDILSSTSDSDSDSLEVNIFRTRNSTFEDVETQDTERNRNEDNVPNPTNRMVFELNDGPRNESSPPEPGRINVTLVNDRFRVRTQSQGTEDTEPANREGDAGTATEPAPGPSNSNPRPSTSRENFWAGGAAMSSDEAYRKVKGGVNALQKHTVQLTNLWLRGNRVTMRELRNMWENLRRRILMLHRETGRQDGNSMPSHYTRSLLERCMMLTNMNESARTTALRRSGGRSEGGDRNPEENANATTSNDNTSNSNITEGEVNPSADSVGENRPIPGRSAFGRSSSNVRSSPSLRRRLSARWRPEDELRRRARNPLPNRFTPRTNRSRRDFVRAIEISATRHEIRMRAMQVLSVMFNMMMMCLEERGLSQLIISMLRTLKKALALTCLMLMMNRNSNRQASNAPAPNTTQRGDQIVVRIQNVDHAGPVNVDGPDEPTSQSRTVQATEQIGSMENVDTENKATPSDNAPATESTPATKNNRESPTPSTSTGTANQRWSNRLAVQIAAANRNTSLTARTRRELYLESKRQKALHRTNPNAHPITKKRVLPPVSNHRIPALRLLPSKLRLPRASTPRNEQRMDEPVAGPSGVQPPPSVDNFQQEARDDMLNEFEHRVNLIRLAHLQAVRLRNAARTRFRRLQTIRLYTPSSVREMFSLQSNNGDNSPGSRSPLQNGPELGNRRTFAAYRPHILTPRSDASGRPQEDPGHFHTVLNNVAMPLMQVNDLPANSAEAQSAQPQRLPRIHEYLQPIILAQNAMVVDDEANGGGAGGAGGAARRLTAGMAGLLDAGIISDTLPAPSHRVQAWDFHCGDTPDIADSTKNVVVQRCRIHNDASIDISKDGRLLVALLPVPRLRNSNHWLGVYSLEWARLGQCLHTAVLEQSAVSVALSPTARHLAVGLGSRRFTSTPHARNNVFALLYRLEPLESSSRTGLSPIRELEQNWEQGFTSLNCLRWAPQPGQGLVYANNTGQLIVMT
ncbi:uncharacterized protein LOC126369250 isoform X2 [Pectinophora gossypiella]|uniref:uncharacterized protein LOC126369250 isoform X2 n=1 Tax=Pectinophora gossypiella TaxID=13191 RepID=UPI00214EF5F1|nr:uncharacterized protein LOC126369250 isoform X2 [Pectinophora gossypiella]